ncbi:MAG: hypothetical protein RIS64_1844 [Bacteroidota bacterium]|jgi:tetratricopeptide (TPR) repeat protein
MNLFEEVQKQIEAGNTEKALEDVKKALKKSPDDVETKRACAIVYYELMKTAYEGGDSNKAITEYGNYYALELPEEDPLHEQFKVYQRRIHPEFPRMQEANKLSKAGKNMEALAIYEEVMSTLKDFKVAYVNVGWCLYRLLAELAPQAKPDVPLINKCFQIYKKFEILGPSNLHAQMLRIALYFKDVEGVDLLDFLHDWNFSNFRDEDFEPFKTANNSTIPSLCERAYLTYSRVLLYGMKSPDADTAEKARKFANEFLPQLEEILEKLPRNVWLPYARALLMSHLGKARRAQMELVHIIKYRNTEFWAWASLAESFAIVGENQQALSCFCKAFLLPAQGELAAQVRESFAGHLLRVGMNSEAKTEIENIVSARKKKATKLSRQITEWRNLPWYRDLRIQMTNKLLYTKNAGRADALLWADLPDSVAVVTHVDKQRAVFFFAVDKKVGGKHNLKGIVAKVQVGDILALKLREVKGEDGMTSFKVVGARYEKDKIPADICRRVIETIQIPYGRDFGFMKPSNIYVAADLVKGSRLYDGQRCQGIALLSYNKAKAEWGWKMIAVNGE